MMVNICKWSEKGRLFFFDLSSFIWFLAYILIPLILVQTRRRKGYEDGGGKDWVRTFILERGLVILWELRGYGMEGVRVVRFDLLLGTPIFSCLCAMLVAIPPAHIPIFSVLNSFPTYYSCITSGVKT